MLPEELIAITETDLWECLQKISRYCRDQNDCGSGKCFQELVSEQLLILLQDRPCLELIIVSSTSTVQALLFWQDKLLRSVGKVLIPVKKS